MIETQRRSFIKGLFFASVSPLLAIPAFNVVQANTLNLAKVDVTFFSLEGYATKITLDDLTDKDGMLRSYVDSTLQYMNDTATPYSGDYDKLLSIQHQVSLLQPLKERRLIYRFVTISDSKNHTPYMEDRGIKNLDTCIETVKLNGHYGFRFSYDPNDLREY